MSNRKKSIIITIGVIALVGYVSIVCVIALIILSSPMLTFGLKQGISDFSAMASLQKQVAVTFPAAEVQTSINYGHTHILEVSFVNPDFTSFPYKDREENAEAAARLVFQSFSEIDHIDAIRISFVERQRYLFFCSDSTFSHIFDTGSFR